MNSFLNKEIQYIDLGLIDYQQAWDYQTDLFNKILAVKSENRNRPNNEQLTTNNYLLFCEHPHVYTLGNHARACFKCEYRFELFQPYRALRHQRQGCYFDGKRIKFNA